WMAAVGLAGIGCLPEIGIRSKRRSWTNASGEPVWPWMAAVGLSGSDCLPTAGTWSKRRSRTSALVYLSTHRRQGGRDLVRFRLGNRHRDRLDDAGAGIGGGVPQVPRHHPHAREDQHAAEPADQVHRLDRDQAVEEAVLQRAVGQGGV